MDQIISAATSDSGIRPNPLRRGSARLNRNAGPACLMGPPLIQPFEQRRQLRCRQPHHHILQLRLVEFAIFEPLRIETYAGAVPSQKINLIRSGRLGPKRQRPRR